ncbi:MAG: PH domain-containing protein [Candidatus Geothermincolia bacterium]
MKYPDSMLSSDESVIFDVHHHPVVLVKPIAFFDVFLAAWLAVLFSWGDRPGWFIYAGLFILLALALYLAWKVQVWTHTNLVLTNQRLIYQTGVFARHSREVPLPKINDVSFFKMVLGRLLGMGDLVVETASESGPFAFFSVPAPERLKMQILEQIKETHAGPGEVSIQKEVAIAVERHQPTSEILPLPPERPPLYSEIVDQIERLDGMRERGVLTAEEFQQAKDALLGRLSKGTDIDS